MHRAIANSVAGKRILADGKWLTAIGNINVKSGDYVWTDGKCVYGHQSEGGGNNIVIASGGQMGIPLLYSANYNAYVSGKIIQLGSHSLGIYKHLINRGNRFQILSEHGWSYPDIFIDAEYDDEGNLYTLFRDFYYSDDYSDGLDAAEGISGGWRVEKNGAIIARYYAADFLAGLGRTRGVLFYVGYAKLDVDGSFKLILSYLVTKEPNPDIRRRLFFDGTKTETWTSSGYTAPAHSIRFPIQDGWFCTFAGAPDDESPLPYPVGRYTVNCYNEREELAFSIQHCLPYITGVCPVAKGKYLFMKHDSSGFGVLGIWDNGTETTLQSFCGNLRLRKTDIRKWKKQLGL